MTRVVLVRHAATEWSGVRFCGRTDLPLSSVGRMQAIELARRLAEARLTPSTVRSSPASRALQTAALLADALGLGVETDLRVHEVDFGLAEGRTFGEIQRQWPTIGRLLLAGEVGIDWPEGERASDLRSRIESLARDLESSRERDLVVVTHGGPIRALAALLGLPAGVGEAVAPAQTVVLERGPHWHVVELMRLRSLDTAELT